MTVRAKMKCVKNDLDPGNETAAICLEPVISGSEENKRFFKWTPGGSVVLGVVNKSAAAAFEVGKEYYVDFTPAE